MSVCLEIIIMTEINLIKLSNKFEIFPTVIARDDKMFLFFIAKQVMLARSLIKSIKSYIL